LSVNKNVSPQPLHTIEIFAIVLSSLTSDVHSGRNSSVKEFFR
jgi:hypothetical protein